MGGCSTKPKVLKDDDNPRDNAARAPIPAPSNSPPAPRQQEEEVVDTVVKEDVVDHDSATKNSSLGKLFKENEERKDSAEMEKETVKVADVSETTNTPMEVEKTIPEDLDSSLKKKKEAAEEEKKTEEEKVEAEVVVGEIAEKKEPDDVINVITPEEQNLDHIKPRITEPEEKLEIPQPQEEEEEKEEKKKETEEESMKQNPPPPPAAPADQESFATPKEKPEENNAIPEKVVEVEVEEEEKKKKPEENIAIPKVVEMEVEEDKKKKPEEIKQKIFN